MGLLVDEAQTIYIKGKSIIDTLLYTNEVIFQARKCKIEGVIYKLDFVKVFDRLNISYLFELLKFRDFLRIELSGCKTFFFPLKLLFLSMMIRKLDLLQV